MVPHGPRNRLPPVFACALLRTRGFTARVRAGFVTHAGHLTGEDLWVTEVWAGTERRWIRAHPDPPGHESTVMNPASVGFLAGGEAWQRYRGGLLPQRSPHAAVSDRRGEPVVISSTTVPDLAALCQDEMLPADVRGRMAEVHEGLETVPPPFR